MDYTVFRLFDREPINDAEVPLDVHVFARAYGAAWRALHLCEPVGPHFIECLGLTIDFGSRAGDRH